MDAEWKKMLTESGHDQDAIRAIEASLNLEDADESGTVPLVKFAPLEHPFRATGNAFLFRLFGHRVFNFKKRGTVNFQSFNHSEYYRMSDTLLNYTKTHLSMPAVAAYLLRVLGREEPRHVLYFASGKGDYMSTTVLRGLLELGIRVTTCGAKHFRTKQFFAQPLMPIREVIVPDVIRAFPAAGSKPPMDAFAYHWWLDKLKLDLIYGKNYLIGKRVPQHTFVSEWQACRGIADGTFDTVVIGFTRRDAHFSMHPCREELRMRDRDKVLAAIVSGSDETNVDALRTFHEEGFVTFAREPSCW
jgi:hypothetical protein